MPCRQGRNNFNNPAKKHRDSKRERRVQLGGRSGTDAEQNNETRKLFFKSVADIFGGEKNIPKAVKDAMLMKDYGTKEDPSGKPLTARRIMAVNKVITRLAVEDTVNDVARYVDGTCKQTAYRSAFTDPLVASVANLTPATP